VGKCLQQEPKVVQDIRQQLHDQVPIRAGYTSGLFGAENVIDNGEDQFWHIDKKIKINAKAPLDFAKVRHYEVCE